MRRLGTYGENLATKKVASVTAADFTQAGMVAHCERKFNRAYTVTKTSDAALIFGLQTDASKYGWDAINGFFANLRGKEGSLSIVSPPGASAAQATATVNNQATPTPAGLLTISAGYKEEAEFGVSGNRTGYTIESGNAFVSGVTTLPSGGAMKTIVLQSVVGIRVGDVLVLSKTGYSEAHFVTAVDEGAKSVTWTDADYAGTGVAADFTAAVLGLKIHTWRKSQKGVVTEVDVAMGKKWVTLNSGDPERYISTIFKQSSYLTITVLSPTATTAALTYPAAVTTVAFLAGGLDGTLAANASDWAAVYALWDNLPVRFLANPETAVAANQAALEAYCVGREDNPIAILNGAMDLDKAGAIAAGQGFQRSDEVDGIYVHNWLQVGDPFASSVTAPYRNVPSVGHTMGAAIEAIQTLGIHSITARKTRALVGAMDVVGEQALDDYDRTDLAEAGVNVIQNIPGRGIVIRNWFTPSTAPEFRFGNALAMRNYIKISGVDSLQDSENTPNDIGHVREDRSAMLQFMHRLWLYGSNGNAPEGETFGQYEKSDGSMSEEAEAYEVIADATNNPVASLQAGNRDIDIWFMFPAPAGSIKVGVGLRYKTNS
jgi:hypothetical protein